MKADNGITRRLREVWASGAHSETDSIHTVFKATEQMITQRKGNKWEDNSEIRKILIEQVNMKETEKKGPERWEETKKEIPESKRVFQGGKTKVNQAG